MSTVIVNNILNGKYDKNLGLLKDAIKSRESMLSRSITIGDRVMIAKDVRPKYISGLMGTVESYLNTNLMVKLDLPTAARYFADSQGRIRIPAKLLIKL